MGHVTKKYWGRYDTPMTYDMGGNQFEIVPRKYKRSYDISLNTQLLILQNGY
jgi:hypothetical protein